MNMKNKYITKLSSSVCQLVASHIFGESVFCFVWFMMDNLIVIPTWDPIIILHVHVVIICRAARAIIDSVVFVSHGVTNFTMLICKRQKHIAVVTVPARELRFRFWRLRDQMTTCLPRGRPWLYMAKLWSNAENNVTRRDKWTKGKVNEEGN
jgi:hypothetical protein